MYHINWCIVVTVYVWMNPAEIGSEIGQESEQEFGEFIERGELGEFTSENNEHDVSDGMFYKYCKLIIARIHIIHQ